MVVLRVEAAFEEVALARLVVSLFAALLATLLLVLARLAAVLVVEGFLPAAVLVDVVLAAPVLPRPLLAVAERADVASLLADFAVRLFVVLVLAAAVLVLVLPACPVVAELEAGGFDRDRVVFAAVEVVALRVVRRAAGARLLGGLVSPVSAMGPASFHPSVGELSLFKVLSS